MLTWATASPRRLDFVGQALAPSRGCAKASALETTTFCGDQLRDASREAAAKAINVVVRVDMAHCFLHGGLKILLHLFQADAFRKRVLPHECANPTDGSLVRPEIRHVWRLAAGVAAQAQATRPRREANFTSMGSVGSRQDPGQSRQDPATKHAPGLGEKQISLPRVDRILPGSWPIPSGSCHETCTRPRRDANFTSIRRRRSRRILHAIPPVL